MGDVTPTASQPPPSWPAMPAYPTTPNRGPSLGLAIAALVISVVALIGVGVVGLASFAFVGMGLPMPDDAEMVGGGPLTGKVSAAAAGATLAGVELSHAVTDLLEKDGAWVENVTCPDVPMVDQGVVTVCHGSMFDEESAFVVYFEGSQGQFTLDIIF
jgi:hypothetical protein